MIVQMGMVLVRLLSAYGGSSAVRAAEVGLPSDIRTHRVQRNQSFQVFLAANRAFRIRRRMQNKVLKTVPALPTLVFKDWHNRSSFKSGREAQGDAAPRRKITGLLYLSAWPGARITFGDEDSRGAVAELPVAAPASAVGAFFVR